MPLPNVSNQLGRIEIQISSGLWMRISTTLPSTCPPKGETHPQVTWPNRACVLLYCFIFELFACSFGCWDLQQTSTWRRHASTSIRKVNSEKIKFCSLSLFLQIKFMRSNFHHRLSWDERLPSDCKQSAFSPGGKSRLFIQSIFVYKQTQRHGILTMKTVPPTKPIQLWRNADMRLRDKHTSDMRCKFSLSCKKVCQKIEDTKEASQRINYGNHNVSRKKNILTHRTRNTMYRLFCAGVAFSFQHSSSRFQLHFLLILARQWLDNETRFFKHVSYLRLEVKHWPEPRTHWFNCKTRVSKFQTSHMCSSSRFCFQLSKDAQLRIWNTFVRVLSCFCLAPVWHFPTGKQFWEHKHNQWNLRAHEGGVLQVLWTWQLLCKAQDRWSVSGAKPRLITTRERNYKPHYTTHNILHALVISFPARNSSQEGTQQS